jgi:hypothetical protein
MKPPHTDRVARCLSVVHLDGGAIGRLFQVEIQQMTVGTGYGSVLVGDCSRVDGLVGVEAS